ncbi:MAG: polysaccharide biosynthesis tyrosine autokinase [Verrucomicrobia bacterium]|nr:polysaccharide biosynthesis tyrosine autokinase [Verrucomicrobiota bacterium]
MNNEDAKPAVPSHHHEPPGAQWAKRLAVVRRHLLLSASIFVIIATFGILRAYRAVPIYEAVARLMVERQGPQVTKFADVSQGATAWWAPEFYKTQEGLIGSRPVLTVAAEDPALADLFAKTGRPTAERPRSFSWRRTLKALWGAPPPLPPEPWEILQGLIRAKHQLDTHFINIRCEGANPAEAARIVNAVARAYVKYTLDRRLEISNDAFLFLRDQKLKTEKELSEAEARMQQFREESNISSLDAQDRDHPIIRRLSQLNDELTGKQLARIEIEAQNRAIQQALKSRERTLTADNETLFAMPSVREDDAVGEIRKALVAADSEIASLQDIYGPEHPRLQTSLSRAELLRSKLRNLLKNLADSLTVQLTILTEEERALRREYEEQNSMALDLARGALTFERLFHEVDRQRKLYQVLIERMSEVELTSEYTRTNVEFVEEAAVPRVPVRPDKGRLMLMSLLLALAAGVGAAFLREYLDQTIRSPDDLEMRLGLTVLGFVPRIKPDRKSGKKHVAWPLISEAEFQSSLMESYRHIRTNLFLSGHAQSRKALLITSAGPGDGKTTVACNLALSIAQSGKRVLLVDADFRRPRVHRAFNLENASGLSNLLTGEKTLDQCVQKSLRDMDVIDRLDILATGPTPPNPTELLESGATRQLLESWRERYDRIVLDTTPVLFVSDASILGSMVDGVILVVRPMEHPRAHALRAKHQLEKVHARLIGGILNGVQVHRMGHYYSDYYYYGYARYRANYYDDYYKGARKGEPETEPQQQEK